jgi:hypothetical protein
MSTVSLKTKMLFLVLNIQDTAPVTKLDSPVEDLASIGVSDNGYDDAVLVVEKDPDVSEKFEPENILTEAQEEFEDDYSADRFIRASASPPCGLRERTLLCPIQVEEI